MQKLATYFGMTVQEMLAGEVGKEKEKPAEPKSDGLTPTQAALIEYCRNLSEGEAATALATLIALRTAQQRPGSP